MKKYELIKEYPGSLKLGTIVDRRGSFVYFDVNSPNINNTILQNYVENYVENYPDYWKEIIENYKILSYYNHNMPHLIFMLMANGKFMYGNHELSEKHGCYIHSIKRLSDGEVFTIGDIVQDSLTDRLTGNAFQEITYFYPGEKIICQAKSGTTMPLNTIRHPKFEILSYICTHSKIIRESSTFDKAQFGGNSVWKIYSVKRLFDDEIFKIMDYCHIQFNGCSGEKFINSLYINKDGYLRVCFNGVESPLNNLTKKEFNPTLFTTEDGVDVKKGDNYCAVFYDFKYLEQEAIKNYKLDNAHWRFSTRDLAEQFIIMNKPCLSITDVMNAGYGICNPLSLINIVKQKL